jgi:adenosylcobinamide kinase/adenosylcobinamide-phosphate guanylyltransferase
VAREATGCWLRLYSWYHCAAEGLDMTRHLLVLGGARSGKTAFAERLAMREGHKPAYLATADALDGEMRERVESHQRGRAGRFETIEEPLALSDAIIKASARHDVILVDCLTLWITNMLMAGEEVAGAVEQLAATLVQVKRAKIILVSNEVGLGIVPDNAMARTFRDLAGSAHQRLAEICDDVYFVAAGLPMVLKGEPPSAEAPRIYEA